MKKLLLILIAFFAITFSFGQEMYFQSGTNFNSYDFKSAAGPLSVPLQEKTGTTYEFGYKMPFRSSKFFYSIGLSLNEYNAISGSVASNYTWNTTYIGLQNTFSRSIIKSKKVHLDGTIGLGLSTIIYGKQQINNLVVDIKKADEFSGIFLTPTVGIQTKYKIKDIGFLSLGYTISKAVNPFNTSQNKLSFNTKQLLFGIHFNVN